MNPSVGQYVQCILRSNSMIEGFVKLWSDNQSILESKDGSNTILIQKTSQDVMIVRIIKQKDIKKMEVENSQLKEKVEKQTTNVFNNDDNKRLVELRAELKNKDKEIIANKLKEHFASNVKPVKYQFPRK